MGILAVGGLRHRRCPGGEKRSEGVLAGRDDVDRGHEAGSLDGDGLQREAERVQRTRLPPAPILDDLEIENAKEFPLIPMMLCTVMVMAQVSGIRFAPL